MQAPSSNQSRGESGRVPGVTYWRVEGSLFEISALRSVGFFDWNSQSFLERWVRRAGSLAMGVPRPPAYLASPTFATRLLHSVLSGITRDRLDLLGEEYFQYELKPKMRREAVDKLVEAVRNGERVIFVSQLLEHILRPMTEYFGAEGFIANRLEFRDGETTGRLREPVIRPRSPFAWLGSGSVDGRIAQQKLLAQLGWSGNTQLLDAAVQPALRSPPPPRTLLEGRRSTAQAARLA